MRAKTKAATAQDFVRMFPDEVINTNQIETRKMPKAQTFNRMMAHGIDHTDYSRIVARVANGEDYVQVCEELGDASCAYAAGELEKGHRNTARVFFLKAAALYRVAPYEIINFTEEKSRIYNKELASFSRAVQLYENMKAEKVEIPYKDSKMCGWMCIPRQAPADVPVIVLIGGLTGFKEELHFMAMKLVEAGFAVLNMDGPGQGETFYANQCYFEVDSQEGHRAILDYIISHGDVGNKIGLYGLCFGGYFVARTAAYFADEVAACASVGGSYIAKEALRFNRDFLDAFTMRSGKAENETEYVRHDFAPRFNLEGIAEKITCPLLIIHNDPDPLISAKNVKRLYEEAASADKTFKVYPGSDHCAYNDYTEVSNYVADWFADRLLS
ncbi:alpha/beta hydrolase fold [Lucifera butyrica]|uniref:Alpha/beta hydrolase fold n=1 Tax=Lucifera butyrica TaxID=1351585 RepID=A0A498R3L1_9FIRM|nr:alpha/beta fold hydrolase [Lucifera butyrica]VBB05769.1 alpha/beta hydrolase fold [Lucifera butyrica]